MTCIRVALDGTRTLDIYEPHEAVPSTAEALAIRLTPAETRPQNTHHNAGSVRPSGVQPVFVRSQ
jgi:hypothetical protein